MQFVAWGFGLSAMVLLVAISNGNVVQTLDRAGLIWLFGIIAVVLIRLVSLGALIVSRQSTGSRTKRKR